jgi:hypothetical protein
LSVTVCLFSNAIGYPDGGGYLWEYLNWALGVRGAGCELIWLEGVSPTASVREVRALVTALKRNLEGYDLSECLALCSCNNKPLPKAMTKDCLDLEAASEADLLLNLAYDIPRRVVKSFRRSAMVDVDPGLTQVWISTGMKVPPHNFYFTTGEAVGQPGSLIPDCGLHWHYTPPAVFLPAWPVTRADSTAPFTTVAHWYGGEWVEYGDESYPNNKREGFEPFLSLPQHTSQPLELALCLGGDDDDDEVRARVRKLGWLFREADAVASTPWDYQRYIQGSRGEFSCVKPSCIRLQNAWIGDRTICYLASGKPVVIQHTGPSRFLPDAEGLFRFRNLEEAIRALAAVEAGYERHCRLARALAEEYFDATKVARRVLEVALA